jgi:hypothetical protein
MSWATLNREVCALARTALNNPKLRVSDIVEWSTGEVKPEEGEIAIKLGAPLTGINVVVEKKHDKRSEEKGAKNAKRKRS